MILKTFVFLFLLLSLGLAAWCEPEPAEEPDHDPVTHRPKRIDTDRPHVSEAPVVVGTGTFQIESGVTGIHPRGGGRRAAFTPTLLRFGTSTRNELRVEGDFLNQENRRLGFGDFSLGLKQILIDDGGPEVALLFKYSAVTGSPGFQGVAEPELKLLLGLSLDDETELEVNLGARSTVDPEGTARFLQGSFACAVTHALGDQLSIFGEVYGDGPVRPGSGALMTIQGGFLYRVNNDFQLDLEVLRGLSATGTDWGLGVGISARY